VHEILTPRLSLRSASPEDATRFQAVIQASLEHLRRWLPWAAQEPQSIEDTAERLRRFHIRFETGRDFVYLLRGREGEEVLGAVGLHRRIGAGAGEIGYWVAAAHTRRGYATEAAAAVTRIGFEVHRMRFMEIHCDPANLASAGVPRKLGYTMRCVVNGQVVHPARPPRNSMIWSLDRVRFTCSRAAAAPIEALDELGRNLPRPQSRRSRA
jgi:RimJ/RimL family protein N-acetyltransferase